MYDLDDDNDDIFKYAKKNFLIPSLLHLTDLHSIHNSVAT